MIDLHDHDRWIELGESTAWRLPGSKSEVIFNDREDDRFVSYILDVKTGKRRTLPAPIYALSPDARWTMAPDFRRLHDLRPGYGYAGIADPNKDKDVADDAGIWRLDLWPGKHELLFTFADAAERFHRREALVQSSAVIAGRIAVYFSASMARA